MNKVILIGNLANDPEYTQVGDAAKCSFRLAVQRRFVNAQGVREADFLQVICWRRTVQSTLPRAAKRAWRAAYKADPMTPRMGRRGM